MITLERLSASTFDVYENLNQGSSAGLIYGSIKYKNFLQSIFPRAETLYLLAWRDSRLAGALPCFMTEGPAGLVMNSLPFYGSHGAPILSNECEDPTSTKLALIEEFDRIANDHSVASSTIISNPFQTEDHQFYENNIRYTYKDERIGQVTRLPDQNIHPVDLDDALMGIFHQKTRNVVRKSQKGMFDVEINCSEAAFDELHGLHAANMASIGGTPKSRNVFSEISNNFSANQDYRIFLARKNGKIAAALLLFYYNGVVEYFTPAINDEYRSDQVLSFLIFEAMKDAVSRGMREWNWGGTWKSQSGVYLFKSRWGARDLPYYYYIHEHQEHSTLKSLTASEIVLAYPGFYTIPFSELPGND